MKTSKEYQQRRSAKIARNKIRRVEARKRMKHANWLKRLANRLAWKEKVAELEEAKLQKRLEMARK
jgi:hypothetical protein